MTEKDLKEGRVTDRFRALMRSMIGRTRELFEAGRPLCTAVGGRLRWELKLTWLGGTRILDAIEAVDYDVFRRRPRVRAADAPRIVGRAVRWRN